MAKVEKPRLHIEKGDLKVSFSSRGRIYSIIKGNAMFSRIPASDLYGSVSDIYIRVHDMSDAFSLFDCSNRMEMGKEQVSLYGQAGGLSYRLSIRLIDDSTIDYRLDLDGKEDDIDVLFVDSVGVGTIGGVLSNELYNSQYLDIASYNSEYGWALVARQNMGRPNPVLIDCSYGIEAVGYATDEMQFLGIGYKENAVPKLLHSHLPNQVYQGELSCLVLETEGFSVDGKKSFSFISHCFSDYPGKCDTLSSLSVCYPLVRDYVEQETSPVDIPILSKPFSNILPLSGNEASIDDIERLFPERELLEADEGGNPLSFFLPDNTHVVLKRKELIQKRPSGTIAVSLLDQPDYPDDELSFTSYSYGLFLSQVVTGNTNLNKLLSVNRGLLDTNKSGGLRMLIKVNGKYRILGVPTFFVMGFNFAKWVYLLDDDSLTVSSWMGKDRSITVSFKSEKGKHDVVITNFLVLGEQEGTNEIVISKLGNAITIKPGEDSYQHSRYPDLSFLYQLPDGMIAGDDSVFYVDGVSRSKSLLVLSATETDGFSISITGSVHGAKKAGLSDFNDDKEAFLRFQSDLVSGFRIDSDLTNEPRILEATLFWYSLDALVHFSSPHGLEQSGGAAWGTRDVCQGPFEFFLSLGKFDYCRNIVRRVYSNQNAANGEWPQWFMMDEYGFRADDCHGDVVFWPLEMLAEYLINTGDYGILLEKLPLYGGNEDTLYGHIGKALANIQSRMIEDYDLITYAGGDWDDTLQPIDPKMKASLVSSWTQALLYQTATRLSLALQGTGSPYVQELDSLAKRAKEGFDRYLVKNGKIAGFALIREDKLVDVLLHPDDDRTGIKTRLLPMTRAIISRLADKDSISGILDTIDSKLNHVDGVRLMDAPAHYDHGISTIFVRAEQAANVGREISLLYVHAHIRYCEAMATLGLSQRVKKAMFQATPVLLSERVHNAEPRQANAYFSSSDPDFPTRYAFKDGFGLLKKGKVGVRGGWRVYSSGPGIYTARLIRDMFGLRLKKESVIIDPSLDYSLDGSTIFISFGDRKIAIRYHMVYKGCGIKEVKQDGKLVPGHLLKNPYREPGIEISLKDIKADIPLDVYLR